MRRYSFLLLSILAVALLIRVLWALIQPSSPTALDRLPDQREYFSLAQNLLHQHRLYFIDTRFGQTVYAYRLPGYPLFLAGCGASVRIARLAQAMVDLLTVLAVFLIGRRLSRSSGTGLMAAGLMAINPFAVFFSGLVLSETLFTCLIAWAIWFLVSRRLLPALIFLAAGCYVRPTGILLCPLLLLAAEANAVAATSYRLWDVGGRVAAGCLFLALCLLPWAWRNHHLLRQWIWTTTNDGITFYDGFHPGTTGGSDQQFITDLPVLWSMNEVQRSSFFKQQAGEWIGRNWKDLPTLSLRKVLRGWSPVPLSREFGKPMYRLIAAVYCVPFDLLCVLGLFSQRLTWRARLLLLMPAVVVTIAQVLSVGSIRYRLPAEPALAVLAAAGAASLWKPNEDIEVIP